MYGEFGFIDVYVVIELVEFFVVISELFFEWLFELVVGYLVLYGELSGYYWFDFVGWF